MIAGAVAKRYAKAIFELAVQKNAVDACARSLAELADAWDASPELRAVIESPAYVPSVKRQVMIGLATRVGASEDVKGLVALLAERRRLGHLRAIADVLATFAEQKAGRLRAEIVTATKLPESYYAELEKALGEATGKKVVLVRREDPSIIGGVVARVGDTVFDGSIRSRLLDLRHDLLVAASPQSRA